MAAPNPDHEVMMECDDRIEELRLATRIYAALLRANTRLENQILALGRQAGREPKRSKLTKAERARRRAVSPTPHDIQVAELATIPLRAAQEAIAPALAEYKARIEKYARALPAASWVASQPGAGMVNFGLVIGAAGNLSGYSRPKKLWKRFGLTVVDGERQGFVSREGRTPTQIKAEWILRGYSPQRRAVMYQLGGCLIKQNVIYHGKRKDLGHWKEPGRYRRIYDERKSLERAKAPDLPPMQLHRRAQRYMEQRFLVDLWMEWNRTSLGDDSLAAR